VHTSRKQFLAQVNRDRMKAAMCKEHGVCLLLVPHTISRAGMTSFLKAQLQAHQIPIATGILDLNSNNSTCEQLKVPAQPAAAESRTVEAAESDKVDETIALIVNINRQAAIVAWSADGSSVVASGAVTKSCGLG